MPRLRPSPPAAPLRLRRAAQALLDDLELHLGPPGDHAAHPILYLCAADAGRAAGPDPLTMLRKMLTIIAERPEISA